MDNQQILILLGIIGALFALLPKVVKIGARELSDKVNTLEIKTELRHTSNVTKMDDIHSEVSALRKARHYSDGKVDRHDGSIIELNKWKDKADSKLDDHEKRISRLEVESDNKGS